MSTIQANAILDASGGNTTTVNSVTPNTDTIKGRNLIINGAMQVAQRGTSATVGPNGTGENYTTLDRWNNALNHGTAVTTFSQSTDAPSGFGYSLKYEVTTAQSSLSSSDFWLLNQRFEGQDLQGIGKGTSDAKQLTLSFWVKATKTGTNNVELTDNDNNRFTTKQFTVNTSNTWEYKTLVFDADTTGAFDNDNASSLNAQWWISAGTNWTSGSVTSWASEVAVNRAPGQVNNLDTVGNVFQLTGVKLEVGSIATEFDHRSYAEELARCQRYFRIFPSLDSTATYGTIGNGFAYDADTFLLAIPLSTRMRSLPSVTSSGNLKVFTAGNPTNAITTVNTSDTTRTSLDVLYVDCTVGAATLITREGGMVIRNNDNDAYMAFDAEI
jgi:hypothetical protein